MTVLCRSPVYACLLIIMAAAAAALAQAPPMPGTPLSGAQLIATVNEDGTATINGLPAQSFPDPNTGAPTWILPVSVVPGDVIFIEDPTGGSDVLRFPEVAAGISDRMILYSDPAEPGTKADMADVGVPTQFQTNRFRIPELGPPTVYPAGSATYNVNSDVEAVPLPAAAWMGMSLLGGVVAFKTRRKLLGREP